MWETLFRRDQVVRRLRQGPFGPYLEALALDLQQQQYSLSSIRESVCSADHFGRWLVRRGLTLRDANAETAGRYRQALGRCPAGRWPKISAGLSRTLRFLVHQGVAPAQPPPPVTLPRERWLERFEAHLAHVVGAAPSTRQRYRPILARFLITRFGAAEPDWTHLRAEDLTAFVQGEAAQRTGFGRKVAAVALRAFLRFLVAHGVVPEGLAAAIPAPRQWQHAALPRRATAAQVAAVLARCQDGTAVGLRDHAVLLLLARLGLRAKEVVDLALEDLDWHAGRVVIRAGKTRRARVLPLSAEVGTALAAYLQRGRPSTAHRAVFLHSHPPYRPWRSASAVSRLARRRLRQSGVPEGPWLGAHLFRHTVASALVNAGASYKEVADLLGHQSVTTTGIYAKLNLETLARVALPWAGGAA